MHNSKHSRLYGIAFAFASFASIISFGAVAKDIYVDVAGSDQNTGAAASSPLRTVAAASERAMPGDTIWIMPGDYKEPLKPVRSGRTDGPITYRATNIDRRPTVSSSAAIVLEGVSHIAIDGIAVNGGRAAPNASVNVFADITNSSHIVITNGDFRYANSAHGIRVRSSTYITISNNTIDFVGEYRDSTGHGTGDNIGVDEFSSRILIKNNTLRHGGHNLINMNGRESVIRENYMDNSWRDVFGGEAGYRIASIKGRLNVVERNHFVRNGIGAYYESNVLAKILGEFNIARLNVFTNAIEQAISSDSGGPSPVSIGARIYQNTFYSLQSGAWRMRFYASTGKTIGSGIFVNNLVQRSRTAPANSNQDADIMFLVKDYGGGPTADSKVIGNIFSPASGTTPIVLLDGFDGRTNSDQAAAKYPSLFARNATGQATFSGKSPVKMSDFSLSRGSLGIDAGVFLSRAEADGTNSRLPVADTYFFCDGLGLVPGDEIQLEGSATRASVIRVDHGAKVLELDRVVSYRVGQGVGLAYTGTAPDVGAFEYGIGTSPAPAPPLSLSVR